MYFKKLEIFGFKSFAEKTILEFGPGITAIVGPNGCGKSNVFDAIRWVLGEQSIKELRGSSKEDVIFNGTSKKAPLGFAEVSLTFSNQNRNLQIDTDEVIVTRRLFRSGESEYLLNKSVCRLKDIQELLMGTGIGAEAYSLIQQGKVELVVNAKPEDRRMIFDEASGITKYKAKKKEAMNRLRDTENNLLRVNDIVVEVKRQIGSIERQANKARRYKEEYEKLKGLEIKIAKHHLTMCTQKQNDLKSFLNSLKEKEDSLSREQEELTLLLNNEINCLGEVDQKINDINAEEIKLSGKIDINHRQISFNEERIENIEQNDNKLKEQKEQLIERCKSQQNKIAALKGMVTATSEALTVKESSLHEKQAALANLEKVIRDSKSKIMDNEEKVMDLSSEQIGIRNKLTEVMKETQLNLARKRRLEIDKEKILVEKSDIDEKLLAVDIQIQGKNNDRQLKESDKQKKNDLITDLKNKLIEMDAVIDDLEKKKVFFLSQKEFIEKLNTQYQDIPNAASEGKFITSVPPQEHHTGIIGKVKKVGRAYVPMSPMQKLTNFFSRQNQMRLYEIICETKFIELDPQQILLKVEEIEQDLVEKKSQKQSYCQEIKDARRDYSFIENEIAKIDTEISVFESQKNDIMEECKKIISEMELNELELSEVNEAIASIKTKEEDLNYQLDTVTQDIEFCQKDTKEKQEWIAEKSSRKEETTVSIAQIETEIQADRDKLLSQQENFNMFSSSLDEWLDEIKSIDDEILEKNNKKCEYAQEIESLKSSIIDIEQKKEMLLEELSQCEIEKEELGVRISDVRTKIQAIEGDITEVKQKMHGEELSEQELSFSEKGIKDRLMQTYKLDLDNLPEQYTNTGFNDELDEDDNVAEEIINMDELMPEVERLRKKCESFGSVNLVAIEEFEELKGRFEFLTKQQADLLEAKSQLMSTINKINRSTRQMFMDTFTKVSEEFRIYFRMLFGGGEANLILIDPENVLESGIDIVVRPPGKKRQNISLLSGGEKTLTAIALIFGVFKVNPSPFCVLDEIDAALDESNVGRFSFLLQDFSNIAQFIVISHNKKTMSKSDVMYGITMPETGVSRVVSVKFSDFEKKEQKQGELVGV